jgi:CubicO group peptidase (beta-lactamase class C family)
MLAPAANVRFAGLNISLTSMAQMRFSTCLALSLAVGLATGVAAQTLPTGQVVDSAASPKPAASVPAIGAPVTASQPPNAKPAVARAFVDAPTLTTWVRERAGLMKGGALLVAVIDDSGVRYESATAPNANPVKPDSIFELGAVSKVLTGLLTAVAAGKGEIRRADTLEKFVGVEGATSTAQYARTIRVETLAVHRAGLPRLPCNSTPFDAANPLGGYRSRDLIGMLSATCWNPPKAEGYAYSSVGYGLLGYGLATKAGTSFPALLKDRVTEPLDMTATFSHVPRELRPRLAVPHNAEGKSTATWDLDALAPALGLKASAEDLAKLLVRALQPRKDGIDRAMSLALQPRAATDIPNTAASLGWLVTQFESGLVHWQSGSTFGSAAFIALDRGQRRAVLVLANGAIKVEDLGLRVLLPVR